LDAFQLTGITGGTQKSQFPVNFDTAKVPSTYKNPGACNRAGVFKKQILPHVLKHKL
jgi:hypothetical protein